ncbi:MAG: tetratricopeptide repeat protein [Deltaproteobacteria bacterium]|nr:tetratricopeptide repeat protein [Deltaproteobacteria bacterium]
MVESLFNWGAENEKAWFELKRHLEWADGFWVVFVFSPSQISAEMLKQRVVEQLETMQRPFTVEQPETPDALVDLISAFVDNPDVPSPLMWVEALHKDKVDTTSTARPWERGWETLLLRTNERRERLRKKFQNGLVLVAPENLKNVFRNTAPDLWSVRTMLIELTPPRFDADNKGLAQNAEMTEASFRSPPSGDPPSDPELALAAAHRLEKQRPDAPLAIAQAYTRAVSGLIKAGREDEARIAAETADRHLQSMGLPPDEDENLSATANLASALFNLGSAFNELVRWEDALRVNRQATDLYRHLVAQRPDAFMPDLAMSLNNLGNMYSALGRREEAQEATFEAVEKYRELASDRPDAFMPDLAGALNNLGNSYSDLGRREEALEATLEAVEKYRELASDRPDAFMPDLAMSLNNLGNRYSDLGCREEALEAMFEAVRKLASFFLRLPAAYGNWMGIFLRNYIKNAEAAGQEVDGELVGAIQKGLEALGEN